ncbi:MAG: hypothetical protein ACP5O3_03545 [Candidatus Micrarchaeia archaeon]|jgi:flagellar basal body-associated protein FliL
MRRGQGGSTWTPLYLLIVTIIAAVLVITVLKPVIRHAAAAAQETTQEAQAYASAALFLGGLTLQRLRRQT